MRTIVIQIEEATMNSQEQVEQTAPVEVLEKIRDRTNAIISSFFNAVRSDAIYANQQPTSTEDETFVKGWQVESSSLMQAAAAIATSVILSINNNGIDINELINDHFRSVNTYLKQAVKDQKGTKDGEEANEEDVQRGEGADEGRGDT